MALEDFKSVKIGPYTYQLTWGEEADRIMQQEEKSFDYCGVAIHTKLQICVGNHRADGKKRNTLLHEIVHSILVTYDLDDIIDKSQGEHFVEVMGVALQSLLQDNPHLIKDIIQTVE